MTFIDGYDPYTGEDKIPFIPASYLEAAKTELLALNEIKEIIETKQGEELPETMSEERVTPLEVTKDDETLDQPEASEPEELEPEELEPEELEPEELEPEDLVLEMAPSSKKSSKKTQSLYEYSEIRSISGRKYYEPKDFEEEFSPEDNASDRFTESEYDMIIPTKPDLYSRQISSRNKNKDQTSLISNQQSKPAYSEPSLHKYNKFDAIPDWQRTESQIKKTRSGCGDSCNII